MSVQKDHAEQTEPTAEETTTEETKDDSLTQDDVFHILQCRRRRLVLKYLQEHDTPVKMSDVTERIAAVEHDTTVAALRSQQRQRVYIALYQSHLPKLDEEGVIEYEQSRGIVERTELTDTFDKYLDEEPSMSDDATDAAPSEAADARDSDAQGSDASDSNHRYSYAFGAGLAIAFGIYANTPSSPVPASVGLTIAASAILVALVARRTNISGRLDDESASRE